MNRYAAENTRAVKWFERKQSVRAKRTATQSAPKFNSRTDSNGAPVTKVKDRLREELQALVERGESLERPFYNYAEKASQGRSPEKIPGLSAVGYEVWYTGALSVVRQLAHERVADFVEHYRLPKAPANLSIGDYRLSDAVLNLTIVGVKREDVMAATALHLRAQVAIVKSVLPRLDSVLMDIRGTLQAELLDNELDTAAELAKAKHVRSAGALAGVVLERHLREVCALHPVTITKKKPTLSDFYEALKTAGVIDVPTWRHLQHLGDIRNLCAHDAHREPTTAEVDDMIRAVTRITKTVY